MELLHSELELDDSIKELLLNLVAKIPAYQKRLQSCLENATEFKKVCHEISGTFSSYGFPKFSEVCRELESEQNPSQELMNRVHTDLTELFARLQYTYPANT